MNGRSTRREPQTFWPALATWQTQVTKGNVLLSDAERERAAQLLGDHYTAGRLDHDGYAERLDATFAARTWGDLAPLFRDLPTHPAQRSARTPVRMPPPRPPAPPPSRFPTFALLLVLIGLGMLTNPWVFVMGLGLLLVARRAWRERASARRPGG